MKTNHSEDWHPRQQSRRRSHYSNIFLPLFLPVMLTWSPNPEADLVGYRVYLGYWPGSYHTFVDVGKQTYFSLDTLTRDRDYHLAVTAYDQMGNESGYSSEVVLPAPPSAREEENGEQSLQVVYSFPNPFRRSSESTRFRYFLNETMPVSIKIYNVAGELIKTLLDKVPRSAGESTFDLWDGSDTDGFAASPGLYYAEIRAGEESAIVKVALSP